MKYKFRITIFSILFFCNISATTFAAPDYSQGIINRTEALSGATGITAEKYPNSDTVLIDEADISKYENDGTYTSWTDMYIKIMTEKGRRANTTVASYFTIPYQRGTNDCYFPLIEIIKPDGQTIKIDAAEQGKVMINPGAMSANIYNPNDKLLKVNIPGLEVGDILHLVTFDRIVHARMENTWSDWIVLESTQPILHRTIKISAPLDMPLQSIALKAEIPGTVTSSVSTNNSRIIYNWEVKNVPRMFPEPQMPSLSTVVQRLLVSTIPDWQTVSKWYWKISEPHYVPSPEMKEKVNELTGSLTNDMDKIYAIFHFVSQEIRYMGITVEDTAPGYEPHDVKDTFKDRSGVCRDKAALLAEMLRIAGFKAFPVLINVGPIKDREVPQPYFNHAITAVLDDNGKYILMDSTDETTAKLFPTYLSHMSYLVARPDGDTLRTSPIDPADNNMVTINTSGNINDKGDLQCSSIINFTGINDNLYRGFFARSKPDDRKRFIEGAIRAILPGAHINSINITPTNIMDMTIPLKITTDYTAKDITVSGDNKVILPVPVLSSRIGLANRIIGSAGLEKRKYPLKTGFACGIAENIDIDISPELGQISFVPDNNPITNNTFQWEMKWTNTANKISLHDGIKLTTVEFSPEEYATLKKALKEIQIATRKMPILEKNKTENNADIQVLRNDVEYELINKNTWRSITTVEKKILTYSGKKKNSEIKIHYNPAREKVKVDLATVIDKNGIKHPAEKKEINEMDASWVAAAPRYPAAKILVISLPAVEVGSIIKYRIIREAYNRPFFAAQKSFRGMNPIDETSITVSSPENIKLKTNVSSFSGIFTNHTVIENGKTKTIMKWQEKNIKPIKPEDSLPPWWMFNDTVFLSTGNWQEYTKQINSTLINAAKKNKKITRLTKSLLKNIKSPEKRVQAIRDYVAIHIRHAGPGFTQLPLSAISSAATTLRDAYGNNADIAVLLYTMLKDAGYKPEFVFASTLPEMEQIIKNVKENPRPWIFDSVLIKLSDKCFNLPKGKYIYLNDTDQYAVIGASFYENYLCITPDNAAIAALKPSRPSTIKTRYAMSIDDNGNAIITARTLFYGSFFGIKNKQYTEMTPEKLERHFQSLISGTAQGATRIGKLVHDFDNYPGEITFSVNVPDYAVITKQQMYFTLPTSLGGLFSLRSDERTQPMYIDDDQNNELTVKVELPAGYKVAIKPESWKCNDVGNIHLTIKDDVTTGKHGEKHLQYKAAAIIKPTIISPLLYNALLKIDKRLSHKRAKTVLLEK